MMQDAAKPAPIGGASFWQIGGPISGVFALYGAVYLALAFGPWFDQGKVSLLVNLGLLPVGMAAAIMTLRVARAPGIDLASGRAWRLIGLAYLLEVCGDLAWMYVEDMRGEDPNLSWGVHVLYLLFFPVALWGLLSFPKALGNWKERLKLLLDSLTITTAIALVIWHFVLQPALTRGESGNLMDIFTTTAYPIGDTLVLFGLATVLLRLPQGLRRFPFLFLSAGMFVTLAGDSFWTYLELQHQYETGNAADIFWLIAYLLVMAGSELEYRQRSLPPSLTQHPSLSGHEFGPLSYATVALLSCFVVAVTLSETADPIAGLVYVTVMLILLVVATVRQTLRAEEAAHASEVRLSALVEHSSDVVLTLDQDSTIRYASPSIERTLAHPLPFFQGKRLLDLLHPGDTQRAAELIVRLAHNPGDSQSIGWRMRHAGGEWVWMDSVLTTSSTTRWLAALWSTCAT